MNDSFFAINQTLVSITDNITGSNVITAGIIFIIIIFLIELTEMPAQGKIGIYLLAALSLSTLLGLPLWIPAVLLVIGGVFYFFMLRDVFRNF